MKLGFILFIIYSISACQANENNVAFIEAIFEEELPAQLSRTVSISECDTTSAQQGYAPYAEGSYTTKKTQIADTLKKLKMNQVNPLVAGEAFSRLIVNQLIPHWFGTPWAFEGYTASPKKGSIACGYFVSTTLLHMGLNVNRYTLAKQLPIHEALSIAGADSIQLVEIEPGQNRAEVLSLACPEDGIYFIGFDQSHVGYLYRTGPCTYVIHSDYLTTGVVSYEDASNSPVLEAFNTYYIAAISTNEWLMRCWLTGEEISVVETPDN